MKLLQRAELPAVCWMGYMVRGCACLNTTATVYWTTTPLETSDRLDPAESQQRETLCKAYGWHYSIFNLSTNLMKRPPSEVHILPRAQLVSNT